MNFQDYITEELDRDTISIIELASFIEDYPEMNEAMSDWADKLKTVLDKMGLHATKGNTGLLQMIGKASARISKLLWHAFMATTTGKQEHKDKVIEISKQEVSKEDLMNFLMKIDLLTLHVISGPIHIIDALTGWHIGPKILQGVDIFIDRGKKAIEHLIFIRDKSKDRPLKDKLSHYIKSIKTLILGEQKRVNIKIQEYITEKEKSELELYGIINVIEKYCMPFINEMKRAGLKDWFYRGSNRIRSKKMIKIKPRKNRHPTDMDGSMQEYLDDLFYGKFKWRPRSEGVFATSNINTAKNYANGDVGIFLPVGKNYKYLYNPDIQDLYSEIDDDNIQTPENYDEYFDEDEFKGMWEDEFGEGTYGGTWYYDGVDTGEIEIYDAEEYVKQQIIDDENLDSDDFNEVDDFYDSRLFDWVADMSWQDFLNNKIEDKKEENINTLENIVNFYDNRNLKKAYTSKVEITFKCKEYFLVYNEYANELKEHFLVGNPIKPDFWQKKFDFEKQALFKYAAG